RVMEFVVPCPPDTSAQGNRPVVQQSSTRRGGGPPPLRRRLGFPFDAEELDDVALLEAVEALELDATLEVRRHLAHVLLEALERRNLALKQVLAAAQHATGVRARDRAVAHVAAGDRVAAADPEDLADLGVRSHDFLERGLEH